MKQLLRDRQTLIYSVAIPLFLYPLLLFGVFQAMALVEGWKEHQISEIYFPQAESQPLMARLLEEETRIRLADYNSGDGPDRQGVEEEIRKGRIDGALFLEGQTREGEPVKADIVYSSVRDSSVAAKDRLLKMVATFRDKVTLRMAFDVGEQEDFLSVLKIEERDVASGERKANYVLSLILPLLMVVIILMGAFYPALDVAAGERERRTLETTLICPVSRASMVLGKVLAVASLAFLAFILNLASMTFSLKHVLVQLKVQTFIIPWSSLGVILAAAIVLALLISSLMLVIAFLARSFKEGQSYMTPVYLIVILPMAVTLSPDIRLDNFLASLPIINVVLVFRNVLQQQFDWARIIICFVSSGTYAGLGIYLSTRFLAREEFLLGEGGDWRCRLRSIFAKGNS